MATIKTGYEVPDYSKCKDAGIAQSPSSSAEDMPKKLVYPEFTLRGKAAGALIKAFGTGEDFTAKVKFRMVEIRDRKRATSEWDSESDSQSVDLEIISLEHDGVDKASNADEEDVESAIDKYRESKKQSSEEEED